MAQTELPVVRLFNNSVSRTFWKRPYYKDKNQVQDCQGSLVGRGTAHKGAAQGTFGETEVFYILTVVTTQGHVCHIFVTVWTPNLMLCQDLLDHIPQRVNSTMCKILKTNQKVGRN